MAKKRKKNLQSLDSIPMDVLFEILLRLPAKSVARFFCVSKLWATFIRDRHFIRSYSLRSSPKKQPCLLLAFNKQTKGNQEHWYFFSKSTLDSTPLCPNPEPSQLVTLRPDRVTRSKSRKLKALVVAEEDPKALVVDAPPSDFVSRTVCYLKETRHQNPCYAHGLMSFLYGDEQVISNPSTGKSITLPIVKTEETIVRRSFLGYDPIDAQYKVLCYLTNSIRFCQHKVLTLGAQDCSWRMIQCSIPHHYPVPHSVCVDGVLYYTASTSFTMMKQPFLVGFDLRSEVLEIASVFPEGVGSSNFTNLTNYHGKVALVTRPFPSFSCFFDLWVLEDAKKQHWSKERISFHIGVNWNIHRDLEILGVSDMGEIIFAPSNKIEEWHVYFLDRRSKRIRRVELEGNTKHKFRDFYQSFTFLHYVEIVMFI